jgi:hypothetical protein
MAPAKIRKHGYLAIFIFNRIESCAANYGPPSSTLEGRKILVYRTPYLVIL